MKTLNVRDARLERGLAPDEAAVRQLLDFLPVLYPDGFEWLTKRLGDVRRGDAMCVVAEHDGELVGIALGIIKPSGRFKLSTLYVSELHRRKGVGGRLLRHALHFAEARGASHVYITGAHTVRNELEPLLDGHGFRRVATEQDRYGAGRHEDVFVR